MNRQNIFAIIPIFGDPKWNAEDTVQKLSNDESNERRKALRVVVIDDEVLIADTVVEILKDEGFQATAVSNPQAALELALTSPPDIVLSDVIMPGMTGIEMGIKLREIVPGCKIILFSGQAATVDLLEKARAQGHQFEILAKPIRPEVLIGVIRRASGFLN